MELQQLGQFSGEFTNVKALMALLKAIQFGSNTTCNVYDEGLTFTVQTSFKLKAVVYVKKHMFATYRKLAETEVAPFALDLKTLVNCLAWGGAVGTNTCKFHYTGPGYQLELLREDRTLHATTHCWLKTLEPDTDYEGPDVNGDPGSDQRVYMRSSGLKDAFDELDPSCKEITITLSPENPCFQLIGDGQRQNAQIRYLKESDAIISLQCRQNISFTYEYEKLLQCFKTLELSDQMSLRLTPEGYLHLMFHIPDSMDKESDKVMYVDFYIASSETST
ncbi:ssDNA endodeoxyribonuclease [Apophysomyces sp. BC1015]|nr:ssDNA endodeoxyribonuclease [Apophysomyces sp. BC1015]